jgi:hypothetical protein
MKLVARSVAGALLLIPGAGFTQIPALFSQGDGPNNIPQFFTFMNSEVAPLGTGQLLIIGKIARAGTTHGDDAATIAAARRRAVVRIAAGYEPALAFLQELNAARKKCVETS